MGQVTVIQTSFNSGELSPLMDGRVDQERYSTGCARLLNFCLWPHGAAFRRPGLRFVAQCGDPAAASRLIPFEVASDTAYVLEFFVSAQGEGRMRVFAGADADGAGGGPVLDGDGAPYEIATPYADEEHIRALRFCQSADVMYLVHPAHPPHKLSRHGHTDWRLAQVTFAPSLAAPTGLFATAQGTTGGTAYTYVITGVKDETEEESLPSAEASTASGPAALSSSNYVRLSWSALDGAKEYNVYREKNGVFGWIGKAQGTGFDDKGEESPDVTDTPPSLRDPFDAEGSYPSCVQFFEQRLFFAASSDAPQKLWGSQTANYENFNVSTPLKDDDAVTYTIAADRVNAVVWMMPGQKKLLFGTVGGEWTLCGSGGDPLSPMSVEVARETAHGSAGVAPVTVGNTVLFVQRPGNVVREFRYSLDVDGYQATDVSLLSEHILGEKTITDWAYQQSPCSIIWAVREDGALLALTYLREHQVVGWSRHETAGLVRSVAAIPGGREDALWAVVRRETDGPGSGQYAHFVERLDPVFRGGLPEAAFFVDAGLSADAWNTDEALLMSLAAESFAPDGEAVLTASGHAPFADAAWGPGRRCRLRGKRADGGPDADTACEVEVVEVLSDEQARVRLRTAAPPALQNAATPHWARLSSFLTGLSHLQGATVQVLADGMVQPEVRVGDAASAPWASRAWGPGEIELQRPAAVVHAGLGYVSDLSPMRPEIQDQGGTSQGRTRRVGLVWVRLHETVGLKVGPDAQRLQEIRFRSSADRMGTAVPLFSGDKRVALPGGYDPAANVLVRQDQPLPMTVLGLIMELEVMER
ncbi:hypothetical protein dsx2_1539 [Desulfovibrio sp. X2]|uniref:phage nozzle protein n=1 Tax=Desulfovibrio sp. X2 TaxID=941449 RepID=UPI000358F03F|nr:hypothetical protein [Desulfovibrio sp. X2]EPR44580.1 hypothetical protein dsx2_1539 [Desulfovibrio sp. X2]